MIIKKELKDKIIRDYLNNISYKEICEKYDIKKYQVDHVIGRNNIPRRRFTQDYTIVNDYCEISIKTKGDILKCLIDIEDMERCKTVGVWSITKAGYIINCKSGIYLHRFIMNCPDDLEVDHIYHNLLDNRKSQLRISTPRQQMYNTKLRIDNKTGHRGLYWDKERNKWHVNIKNGEKRVDKRFDDYEEACNFIDEKFKEWHGNFLYNKKSSTYHLGD